MIIWFVDGPGTEAATTQIFSSDVFDKTLKEWPDVWLITAVGECYDIRDKAFGALGLVAESLRFFPDYTMTRQDILFVIIQKQAALWAEQGKMQRPWIDRNFIQFIEDWTHTLGGRREGIDAKAVRKFLLNSVYSKKGLHDQQIRVGWKDIIYLWWWFPSKQSIRWYLHDDRARFNHRRWDSAVYQKSAFWRYGLRPDSRKRSLPPDPMPRQP